MRTLVVGTAGHIDHGKSTLVEALTGIDPDRLKEEKARGITIELGFAYAELGGGVTASFVDVPGHERFVRTMLAGAGGIDAVLLVVAADESVMPQTREHFAICRLLGVRCGAVVLTKIDAVDEELAAVARLDVQDLVAGSFLAGAPIVPVSARTGQGLDALREVLVTLAGRIEPRDAAAAARLPIDRVFTRHGFGTVVTGTLVSGRIGGDDELELLPSRRPAKVRGLHVHGRPRSDVRAGERVAVNLAGLEVAEVERGSVLAARGAFATTRRADVWLTTIAGAPPLRHGARVRVHQGTAEVLARVTLAGEAGAVAAGSSAPARLRLETPAVLARRDRMVLRSYSPPATIGGAVVLDPQPPAAGVRSARAVARLEALRVDDAAAADEDVRVTAARFIDEAATAGAALTALAPRLGTTAVRLHRIVAEYAAHGLAVVAGDWVVWRAPLEAPIAALLAGLAAFHESAPLAVGLPAEEARARWFPRTPPPIVERIVGELAAAGRIVARDTLALAGHTLVLSAEEQTVHDVLDERFRAAGLHPPDVTALPEAIGAAPALIERMLHLLAREKRLVRLDGLVFHADALAALRAQVAARKAAAPDGRAAVDVKTFKDAYGVTRKYAIPLLEYLDRERVTRRAGDVRIVL